MAKDRATVFEQDRQQRETARLAADARRRAAKADVVAAVPVLWDSLTPEGRAHVAAMAVYRTGIRPATWPR
jgi:hypothetical protein